MRITKKELAAYAGMALITIITGLSFIFMKFALRYTNPIDLLAHRFSSAFIMIVLLQLIGLVKVPRFTKENLGSLLLLALFYPVLFFLLQTFGVKYSTASEAGIIFAITPVLTMVSAMIFLKEKTSLIQKLGIILSVLGIFYIIFKTGNTGGETDPKGLILLLLSVISIVAYYTFGKKRGTNFSPVNLTILMTYLAFVFFNAWSLINHWHEGTISLFFEPLKETGFLIPVLYLGILSSLLTSFLSNFALTAISASSIAVFNNLSPLVSIAGGIIILHETLFVYHVIGGIMVLTGIIATIAYKGKNKLQ
ncbi:MAG: DMT family transporter [Bacteroidales bacterium]|jgi:drug/metabolite transporter (DMT)-like permease|nr:DMT family transporter [Bacteroidales bacterium]MDD3700171.1 DMT family transporter [Bacteroidales bacterium]MDY0370183.1 DMT family transporter [Bacteroidales bacterium]